MMIDSFNQIDSLLNLAAVRRFVPLSQAAIERYVQSGEFPAPVLVGRHRLWRASDIATYIANREPMIHA